MDQNKIGSFIKELRKEKNLTQEQLAEEFHVSRRTVSRWETGSNLPDLDILIEMSDFYDVDLRELLDGERKSEKMNEEMKETVLKVAEYDNETKKKMARVSLIYFILGIISLIINPGVRFLWTPSPFWSGFLDGLSWSMAMVAMIFGILYVTGTLTRICEFKARMLDKK